MPTRASRRRTPAPTASRREPGPAFERLVSIMATLRGPDGCAWDRRQTHGSLRGHLLEEAYEAVDAIDTGNLEDLRGELGDVLLQCVFHAQLSAETGAWDISGVVAAIADKLVRRHPHIFAPDGRRLTAHERAKSRASTPEAVRQQWARLKADEQAEAGQAPRVLSGIPRALPALLRAHKIGARASAIGFDWPAADDVVTKIEEEIRELREALDENHARAADELGDVLFSIANLARKLGIEPEAALSAANDKFTRRFDAVEASFQTLGRDVHSASRAELESAWIRVKMAETPRPATAARSRSAASPTSRPTRRPPRRRGPS